ncbi:Uncharacterised protein [Collinsella intestinalis]|nr:Uncharacterised protein [Collinsella intestinalis]
MLLGNLLDNARHGLDDLLARDAAFALEQALGNDERILAHDLALLVHIECLHGARAHERVGADLLRGARQDGVALRNVVADLATLARHLVHEGGTARHEQHGEPTHVIVIVEVRNEHVGGLHFVGLGELGTKELRDLLR